MNLYWDLSIVIDLSEESNILCVRWLETPVFKMSDFKDTFQILMESIEKRGIKRLLGCPSKSIIHLPDPEYHAVISLLQSGFAHSKIEKIARIYVDKSERDLECVEQFKNLLNDMQLKINFESFDDRRSAFNWLKN